MTGHWWLTHVMKYTNNVISLWKWYKLLLEQGVNLLKILAFLNWLLASHSQCIVSNILKSKSKIFQEVLADQVCELLPSFCSHIYTVALLHASENNVQRHATVHKSMKIMCTITWRQIIKMNTSVTLSRLSVDQYKPFYWRDALLLTWTNIIFCPFFHDSLSVSNGNVL